MRRFYGEIGLIITAVIWGGGFVATAIALEYYTPFQSMAIRFFIGGVILSIVFYKKLKCINKKVLAKGVILGSILYVAFALQTVGLQFTTPSKNAFITAVNVVIVPLLGFLFYKKRLDTFELIGSILAITGVGMMSLQISGTVNLGDLLTLLCAVAFALHIIYTATYVKDENPVLLTLIQLLTATIIGLIVVVVKNEMSMPMEGRLLLPLIYLGVFSTTIAYLLQTTAQKFISETKAAIILSTEALWGMILSIIVLNELITIRMVVGAILILFAILISETKLNFFKRREFRQKI